MRTNTAAKVAQEKERHPERFCPAKRCLWRTGGTECPRHRQPVAAPVELTPEEETESIQGEEAMLDAYNADKLEAR